jgi:mannose-6-phosphate isomerase-like protein (cupin superfamily)
MSGFEYVPHRRAVERESSGPVTTRAAARAMRGPGLVGRVNAAVGLRITLVVGTMWCAYLFAAIALVSAPAAFSSGNALVIVAWIAQTFLQLVLLPIIIVGQNVQAEAADGRSRATYDDATMILTEVRQMQAHLLTQDAELRALRQPQSRPAGPQTPTGSGSSTGYATMSLPAEPTVVAPDGSDVRVLLHVDGGSMAHFELAPGRVSAAVRHRTVEEVWYVLAGTGRMWRRAPHGATEDVAELHAGVCLTIPVGTSFQFRAEGTAGIDGDAGRAEPLAVVAITIPRWPGPDEAEAVAGHWPVPG